MLIYLISPRLFFTAKLRIWNSNSLLIIKLVIYIALKLRCPAIYISYLQKQNIIYNLKKNICPNINQNIQYNVSSVSY